MSTCGHFGTFRFVRRAPGWLKVLATLGMVMLLSAGACDDAGRAAKPAVDDAVKGARRAPELTPPRVPGVPPQVPGGAVVIEPVADSVAPAAASFAREWELPEDTAKELLVDLTCYFLGAILSGEQMDPNDFAAGAIAGRHQVFGARRAAAMSIAQTKAIQKGEELDRQGAEADFAFGEACSAVGGALR